MNMKSYNATRRYFDLQDKFNQLGQKIEDPSIRDALSIINGLFQETWRSIHESGKSLQKAGNETDIANIHHRAPKMEGKAVSDPLPTGTLAPDFELSDISNRKVKLSDYRGSTVLLVFYPLDWSPGCSAQLDLYQSEMAEFEKRQVKVIGISVDSIYSHFAWAAVRNIHFPLLADFNPKGEVTRKYKVYRDVDGFSERALYIVDKNGTIRYSYVSPYIHHIPDIYELFARIDEVKSLVTV